MADKPFFDAPGMLDDFASIPGQSEQWSNAVSGWIDGNIDAIVKKELHEGDHSQFYNESKPDHPPGAPLDQVIGWAALPGTLRNRWGREQALAMADQMFPLTQRTDGPGSYNVGAQWQDRFYRPQDEYCEWHVTRDERARIVRVTFTSEPPEYWQAMHGDTLPDASGTKLKYPFKGDTAMLVDLYREYVDPSITREELECQEDFYDYTDPLNPTLAYAKGHYNPYNRWNTTAGIMHLTHPANSLSAEINLAVRSTVLHVDHASGRQIVDPEALICCARFGGPNRCSDPTIGSTVNELASLGAHITLRNPIGLAMNHLDLSGFQTPSGEPVDASWFTVLRGRADLNLIERAVFEVPASEGYTVSDLRIGGVPITHGSQIAEHIVVSIVGRAVGLGEVHNTPVVGGYSCCQSNDPGNFLVFKNAAATCAPTGRAAFAYKPATPAGEPAPTAAPAALATTATAVAPAPRIIHRHRTRAA